MKQKGSAGFAHLILIIIILVVIVTSVVILLSTGTIKLPGKLQFFSPKNQFGNYYQNPFEKKQESYINPLAEIGKSDVTYKNPFENLK